MCALKLRCVNVGSRQREKTRGIDGNEHGSGGCMETDFNFIDAHNGCIVQDTIPNPVYYSLSVSVPVNETHAALVNFI